jgi:hypothetical protein
VLRHTLDGVPACQQNGMLPLHQKENLWQTAYMLLLQ